MINLLERRSSSPAGRQLRLSAGLWASCLADLAGFSVDAVWKETQRRRLQEVELDRAAQRPSAAKLERGVEGGLRDPPQWPPPRDVGHRAASSAGLGGRERF